MRFAAAKIPIGFPRLWDYNDNKHADTMIFRFRDRAEAGRLLADRLMEWLDRPEVVVLGLPRGGVPVAYEVARRLHAPLDVFVVRKLGVPGHEELAMGAVASGGIRFLNQSVIDSLRIPPSVIDKVTERERRELERGEEAFRTGPPVALANRVVILIDDGMATGASMRAAVMALRLHHPARVVVASPVTARDTYEDFKRDVGEIVCVQTPEDFEGVGHWYEDFNPTNQEEVCSLLEQAAKSGRTQDTPPN